MLADAPFRWLQPSTWPWFLYLVIGFILVGWLKPLWQWLQRRRTFTWPTSPGVVESVALQKRNGFRSGGPMHTAKFFYSYSVGGEEYSGEYKQEFENEQEATNFLNGLQGKPLTVDRPWASAVTPQALTALLSGRPPVDSPATDANLPAWIKPLLWPFIALSVLGLVVSLWVHLGAMAGRKVVPEPWFFILHIGIFIVWLPAVFIANRRVRNGPRKDYWKVVLAGSPGWMRYMVYIFFGYAIVNFVVFIPQAPHGSAHNGTPAIVWRGFSGHWMAFYCAAFAILYSATNDSEVPSPGGSQLHL